ncbi:hypothetical protein [Mycolicibacterium sp.]|uniref:hypothetical protein n=1 Tax=Mycolicibacterium sp. TaxID=2320850 RepID=UPI00355E15DC
MIDCLSCTVPTDSPEGVCGFCLDYAEEHGPRLAIGKEGWLTAEGDADRVTVFRSPLVKVSGRMFSPVRDHVEACGLRLVYTETDEDPEWIYGQRIREIYA